MWKYRKFYATCEQIAEQVEEIYADLAMIFHWQPSEMDAMTLLQLMDFHKMAIRRNNSKSGSQ